jgi:hypothetical protein
MGFPGLRSLVTFAVGFVLGAAARPGPVSPPPIESGSLNGELERAEQVFGYNVLADAAKRSVDAIRFLDALFFALLAADVALFAVFQSTSHPHVPKVDLIFKGALVLDVVGFLPTLTLRDVPDPKTFAPAFVRMPERARVHALTELPGAAAWNAILRILKTGLLLCSLACTVTGVLALPGASAVD